MPPRLHRAFASACFSLAPAALAHAETSSPANISAEFSVPATGRSVDALAWRDGTRFYAASKTLYALGINIADDSNLVALDAVPGLTYAFDAAAQSIIIQCESICYESQIIRPGAKDRDDPILVDAGAFLNIDLLASRTEERAAVAGDFELGLFSKQGYGGANWTIGARKANEAVRLDSNWTIDDPERRLRLRLGDSTQGDGGLGAPLRFGGVQFGTDFSTDPAFIPFPSPTIKGETDAPSVLDLYVNGALRRRETIQPGPFTLTDTPVVAGAGDARVIVTDALGRETVISAPFYASPSLLRPGLAAYSIAIGAERENFGYSSANYGQGFLAGAYRRGLTDWLTAGGRLEISGAATTLGLEASSADARWGEFSAGAAFSDGDSGEGAFKRVSWARRGEGFSVLLESEWASANFRRLGQRDPPPSLRARGTISVGLGDFGAAAFTATREQARDRQSRNAGEVDTYGLSYSKSLPYIGALSFSGLLVDDGEQSIVAGFSLVRPFGDYGTAALSAETDDGAADTLLRAQYSPPRGAGLGLRGLLDLDDFDRAEAAITLRGQKVEASLEAARSPGGDGVRAQLATGFVWIGGKLIASAPIRDSFALVDVGAPNVGIYRERQLIGRTDAAGRIFVPGLRAYESNRLGVEIDDLPMTSNLARDETIIRIPARSGASVRFPVTLGAAGEARVVDENGAALPPGSMFVRENDGARFPVGRDGRLYISGVEDTIMLIAEGPKPCRVSLGKNELNAGQTLHCESTPQ